MDKVDVKWALDVPEFNSSFGPLPCTEEVLESFEYLTLKRTGKPPSFTLVLSTTNVRADNREEIVEQGCICIKSSSTINNFSLCTYRLA